MSDYKGVAIRKEIIGSLSRVQLYDVSEAGELAIEVEADKILALLAQEVKRIDGCPCLLVKPCSDNCSCASETLSGGCMRCCKYGSMEQRLNAAHNIVNRLERLG